jgi:L-alanine-DL-glutamate epimerase-like enolase superfamily enzyme
MDNVDALARFAAATRVPTAASETLGTRWAYRELLERAPVGVVIFDPAWVGGISEGKKVATLAEAWQLPIAPHDCSGPVEFAAAVHLSINAPNALVQESVRAFYTGWYRELVTEIPRVEDGWVYPPTGPGLGTELLPELLERPDTTSRTSALD